MIGVAIRGNTASEALAMIEQAEQLGIHAAWMTTGAARQYHRLRRCRRAHPAHQASDVHRADLSAPSLGDGAAGASGRPARPRAFPSRCRP